MQDTSSQFEQYDYWLCPDKTIVIRQSKREYYSIQGEQLERFEYDKLDDLIKALKKKEYKNCRVLYTNKREEALIDVRGLKGC